MNLFGYALNPWVLFGGLLAALAIFGAGYSTGSKVSQADWLQEKVELQAEHAKAIDKELQTRAREQKFNQATAKKVSEDHAKQVESLLAQYDRDVADLKRAGGLRIPRSACASGPASSGKTPSASGHNEAGAGQGQLPEGAEGSVPEADTVALPEIIEDRLIAMTKRADELAEQLRAAHVWIRTHGFYGPEK